MLKNPLTERSQEILKTLVSLYIREGQPVASKAIAKGPSLALSSATVRNILAELEEAGYIRSPHTSAGRVPTVLGYRFFVNTLLKVKKELNSNQLEEANVNLNTNATEQELLESASTLISSMTKLTGIVTIPRREQVTFRHIEFLPLSNNRILVILVLNEQEVQNLIIQTEKTYSEAELQQAANYLMTHYASKSLLDIRKALLNEMRYDHKTIDQIMHKVFDTAEKTMQKQQEDYVIAGEANLFNIAEANGVEQLRRLFDAFACKNDLLHLLDQCVNSEGIQIFIGQESKNHIFNDCSLIAAPYAVEDKVLGVLGVIGPTRMDYERVISAVDVTAKLLSAVFKDRIN